MYNELQWWGIFCLDRKKKQGRMLLLSGLPDREKIFLKIEKTEELKNHSDSFVKKFTGTVLYMKEIKFPSKNLTSDLEKKLKEWMEDRSSESFIRLSEDLIKHYNDIPLNSFFKAMGNVEQVSTRDPWVFYRCYRSDEKKSGKKEEELSVLFGEESSLYRLDITNAGDPGRFETEKI